MALYDYYTEPVPDTRILFNDMVLNNSLVIKTYMSWNNYTLNDVTIPVIEILKDHALIVLTNSYGLFKVEEVDTLEPFFADIFIHFPILLQQLAISRLMDALGVVKNDTNTETLIRTEILDSDVDQTSKLTLGTTNTDNNVLNTQHITTGTILNANDSTNTQNSTTAIDNTSGVLATGNKSVNLSHNMPEQSINAVTGNLTADLQGTPILTTAYIQAASENFNTSNPVNTTESSDQIVNNTSIVSNDTLTTNNVNVADTGTTTQTTVNSGFDNSDSLTATDTTNNINETRTTIQTNKQYAYEIKAFLESTDTLNAFKRWEDNFSWVVGIV